MFFMSRGSAAGFIDVSPSGGPSRTGGSADGAAGRSVVRYGRPRVVPDHVLVPLDGSPLSEDALAHALETFDCRVAVLNVVIMTSVAFYRSDRPQSGGRYGNCLH
jgi:hypothetical protein